MKNTRTITMFTIAIISVVMSIVSLLTCPINKNPDYYDVLVELSLALFTGFLLILFQKYRGDTRIYTTITIGLMFTTFSYVTDFLDELVTYPRYVMYLVDDLGHVVALLFLVTGISLWIKENNRMIRTLQLQATTDALTGIPNRLHLLETIEACSSRSNRYRNPFSMIIFDIDHFKKVNDTFGHVAGDLLLQSLSNLIYSQIRDVDTIARYGGEEFVIVLPETDLRGAVTTAEKLRAVIEAHSFETVGSITASFGVAQYEYQETAKMIFDRADKELYRSKESGRNQVFPSPEKRTTIHKLGRSQGIELCAMTL